MGDSTCVVMHGFSYASAIPNESKQGNPMHVLGESISFGRFMTEPLSWERWSTFSSNNKHVEEAQRYAQPGSVAQKKAFFEAHYKRIAAQRAAALLEQQNAASNGDEDGGECDLERENVLDPQIDAGENVEEVRAHELTTGCNPSLGIGGNELVIREIEESGKRDSVKNQDNFENQDTISGSDGSGTPQIEEKPLLKNHVASEEDVSSGISKKRSVLSSSKQRKTWTPAKPVTPEFMTVNSGIQSTRKSNMNSVEKKKSSPKSLRQLINTTPFREPGKEPISGTKDKESAIAGPAPSASRTPKNCRIPWRTPVKAPATNGGFKYGAATTPLSENRRMVKTPVDSTAHGSKTSGPKWHILSSVCTKSLTACRNKLQSPTLSTPFVLRTEERAAKRKQKLEEKFNVNEVQKVQQKTLKEKAGNEIRKLSCGSCFKARPLPEFYKEREMSIINQMKKAPAAGRPQSTVLGKPVSSKKQGIVSMPSAAPAPFPSSLTHNGSNPSKNLLKKSVTANPSRFLSSSSSVFRGRLVGENRSPNIQH